MPGEELSPEDREKLAKIKYAEWFDECMKERFGALFDARFNEVLATAGKAPLPSASQQQGQQQQSQEKPRRRSLLSESLSSALGI